MIVIGRGTDGRTAGLADIMSKSALASPLSATAFEGEVVVLSDVSSVAVSMTAEAALATAELLRNAGLAALEQQRYRRRDPNSGRLPRPFDEGVLED